MLSKKRLSWTSRILSSSKPSPEKDPKGFEFVDKEFKDLIALSDVVISRSGSNAIFELLSCHKPMLLVPLPSTSSRGEQTLNAQSFKKQGFAEILADNEISDKLVNAVNEVFEYRHDYIHKGIG